MSAQVTLKTIIIFTRDLTKLAQFYQHGFSLPSPVVSTANHIGYQLGPVYFGFDQIQKFSGSPPSAVTLWFTVEDVRKTLSKFVQLGARIRSQPDQKPWGATLAAVYDLDGNIIGLEQK
ncbi:VOC family protein [candidate division CSSED10-310 bacterium]|uniref:VOC family protein n=1 Tax=candidate division CSSED10-310 bacterium TaxID=2855610 RepID=A0ABV6YS23_UNCC1